LFRIDFHVSGYLNFDKKNSICSLKFSILLFMQTALKRLILIIVTFQTTFGLDEFAKFLPIFKSPKYKKKTKIVCHFYRVLSQDQLKWIFYLSPTAYAQSGH